MKKILSLAFALLALNGFAQEGEKSEGDTTKVRVGKREFVINDDGISITKKDKAKKAPAYFGGVGFGFNVLANESGSTSLMKKDQAWENEPIKSMTWNINLYDLFIPFTKDRTSFGLVTGAGLTYKSFGLIADDREIITNADTTFLRANSTGLRYDKRKFRVGYITVPLMLSFNTSAEKKKNFHFSAGVLGNLRVGAIYKRKYEINGETKTDKLRDDFNLNPLALDATFRVGYRDYTFFVNYGLTSLFREHKGPHLVPITFGIQL